MAAVETKAGWELLSGGEHGPWGDADLLAEGALMEIQSGDIFGHFHPEDEATARSTHFGAGGEMLRDEFLSARDLSGESGAERAEMVVVAAVGEELGDGLLWK